MLNPLLEVRVPVQEIMNYKPRKVLVNDEVIDVITIEGNDYYVNCQVGYYYECRPLFHLIPTLSVSIPFEVIENNMIIYKEVWDVEEQDYGYVEQRLINGYICDVQWTGKDFIVCKVVVK